MQWPACRWKVSAAGAPGAKITSPSRRSCRASRRTTTNTISSRSARSRPCTRPICRSRRAPTSGTGSRLRNSRSNLEAGAGSKQLLADCDAGINGRFRQHSRWRRVSRRRLVLGRRRTATRLRCAEDRQSRLRLVLRARRLFRAELRGLRQHGRPLALADHAGARHRRPPARLRRPADRAAAAHRLQPRRKLPAPADIRAGIDVSGRASLRVGPNPRSLDSAYLVYGVINAREFSVPVYNLLVIAAAIATAAGFGAFLQRTNYGRILRATAENRAMAEALGVDVRRLYAVVFTIGTVLGTTAGALVVPTAAASLDMAIDFVIEAFAVVVIGGLGSMRGALAGALIVGLIRAFAIVVYPEAEVLAIYVIVIAVLLLRPAGLFGRQAS